MDMQLAICVVSTIAMMAVTVWLGYREVLRWQDRTSLVSRQQVILRVFNCGLLMLMLGQFLWGLFFVNEETHSLRYQVIFWYNCLGLAFIVTMVALIDFYYVMRLRRYSRKWLNDHIDSLATRKLPDSPNDTSSGG